MDILDSDNVRRRSPIVKPEAFFSRGHQGAASHCMEMDLYKWLHDGFTVFIFGNFPRFHG
jgi:hypothetical protein